jgi:nitroreductase
MDVIEAIETRRSRGRMLPDAPPRELVEKVIEAGVHAANHHDTQPWRFFVLSGEARTEFGDALAGALRARVAETDASKLDAWANGERAKPLRSPVLIVVGVVSERDDAMTRREDLQAASAAVQNMLLAANSLGLAAIWRTGDGAYDDRVKTHFGLHPQDEIAGIVYLGYPDPSMAPETRQRAFADRTEWRGPL